LTCVEINPAYVEVGKKILPKATWICGSIFDVVPGGYFDCAISNPPFGNIKTGRDNDGLGGFEFSAIKRASQLAKRGVFILPQMSTPFKYSGNSHYEETMPNKVKSFIEKTGIEYEFNCGIDTSGYLKEWRGVSPMCEICCFDFHRETW
jgi:predicted RNA methylase